MMTTRCPRATRAVKPVTLCYRRTSASARSAGTSTSRGFLPGTNNSSSESVGVLVVARGDELAAADANGVCLEGQRHAAPFFDRQDFPGSTGRAIALRQHE